MINGGGDNSEKDIPNHYECPVNSRACSEEGRPECRRRGERALIYLERITIGTDYRPIVDAVLELISGWVL